MSCWADSRSAGRASVIQARTNTLLILGQSGLMWLMRSAERRSQLHPSIRSASACSRLSYQDRVNPGIPAQADRAQLGVASSSRPGNPYTLPTPYTDALLTVVTHLVKA